MKSQRNLMLGTGDRVSTEVRLNEWSFGILEGTAHIFQSRHGILVANGFRPSQGMDYLATLPEEKQAELFQEAMKKAQQPNTPDDLIQRFKTMRAKFVRPGGFFAEHLMRGEVSPDAVQLGIFLGRRHKAQIRYEVH